MKKTIIIFLIFLTLMFFQQVLPCYAIVHKLKPVKEPLKIDISKLKFDNAVITSNAQLL